MYTGAFTQVAGDCLSDCTSGLQHMGRGPACPESRCGPVYRANIFTPDFFVTLTPMTKYVRPYSAWRYLFALNICLGANTDPDEDQAQPFVIILFSNNKIEIVLNAEQRGPLPHTTYSNMKLFTATDRYPASTYVRF